MAARPRRGHARQVLEDRQDTTLRQSPGERAGQRRHLGRIGAIGPIANHGIDPAAGTSATGAQSTSMPSCTRSSAINRPPSSAALSPVPGSRSKTAP